MDIRLKRAYEPASPEDGYRVLVDRFWPWGVAKDAARIDLWLWEVPPSAELRKWFGHDPAKWAWFRTRYFREMDDRPEAVAQLRALAREGVVTLVYGAKDQEHNDAVALNDYLESHV